MLRVALMYKNYGIQMYYTMGKTAKQFLDVLRKEGVSKAVTSEAAKQLAAIHLSALFFAGVQGLPLYGANPCCTMLCLQKNMKKTQIPLCVGL